MVFLVDHPAGQGVGEEQEEGSASTSLEEFIGSPEWGAADQAVGGAPQAGDEDCQAVFAEVGSDLDVAAVRGFALGLFFPLNIGLELLPSSGLRANGS